MTNEKHEEQHVEAPESTQSVALLARVKEFFDENPETSINTLAQLAANASIKGDVIRKDGDKKVINMTVVKQVMKAVHPDKHIENEDL